MYDATVIVLANGDLAGRKAGNALDRRLTAIEECAVGRRVALYNDKLRGEYEKHIVKCRNDVVEVFMAGLTEYGQYVKRNKLTRAAYVKAREVRWPSHDQHVLAAAIAGVAADVFVTEKKHADCAASIRRLFGVQVVKV